MSGSSVSASINIFSASPTLNHPGFWGRLVSITESEYGDTIIVDLEGQIIELPMSIRDTLLPLVGQRIVLGRIDGQYHAGRCSA